MNRKPQKVGTVGDQVAHGHDVWLHCEGCRRSAKIDIAAIAAKRGRDFKMQWMIERAVCSHCGARWPKLDLSISPQVTNSLVNGR